MSLPKKLGIIGGLGPLSGALFLSLVTSYTKASCDQSHIDVVMTSYASTPDRTAFILGKAEESPLPKMIEAGRALVSCGADVIAVPCNTAHFFYDALSASLPVPIINIIYASAAFLKKSGIEKAGILATEGTVASETYQRALKKAGIDFSVPDLSMQSLVNSLIYEKIKSGLDSDVSFLKDIEEYFASRGCDCFILGCTELSLIYNKINSSLPCYDSLRILAFETVKAFGKPLSDTYISDFKR